MAGKPVGTIFVELDLDASRYTKGQQKLLKDAQTTSLNIEQNFKNLGIKSAAEMDLLRAKIKNSFDMIANSSKATANDIIRAEEAKNAKLKALNDQQFGAQVSAMDKIKKNWIAASAAIAAAAVAIRQAMSYIDEAAKALQIESSFKIMADAAEVNSERMIASMKAATRETIDDSAMMQKAIKLMTLGYNPEQIERFSKVVITASQIAGTTASEAYDELADAIANRMPKALVRMGAATREQMGIVNAAIEAGADSIALYELAMANLELKQKMLKGTMDTAAIAMQRLKAMTEEATESIGKLLIIAIDKAYRGCEYLAGGVMGLASAYASYRAIVYKVMGDEKQEAENRNYANWALEQKVEHLKNATNGILENAEAERRATKDEIDGAKAKVDAQMASLKAFTAAAAAKKKSEAEAEAAAKKSIEVNKRFWEEYKKEVEGAFESEKFKLDEQLKEFEKYVSDKLALERWYQSEKMKIDLKSYAAGGGDISGRDFRSIGDLMGGAENYDIEAQRAKDYAANAKAQLQYAKSVEEQRAAMQKADQELSDQNWWKTYIEDTEDATRANEIFKDSMNIMSQSAADAFAEFVTGTKSAKEAFTQMAQSIIASMARISAQKGFEQLFGMIFSGAGGLFGSLFGGGSTGTGMGSGAGVGWGGQTGDWGATMHSGGIMSEGGPSRRVPAMVFANAPRYHDGLAPDEMAAILKRDEGVFTPGQMKALGGRSTSISVPVTIEGRGGLDDRRLSARMRDEVEATVKRVLREEMR